MATQIILDSRYEFKDDKELRAAQLLSEGNLQFIKTQIAIERQRLLNLRPDPSNYTAYVQEHAAISGAISAYELLVNGHTDVITSLNTESSR